MKKLNKLLLVSVLAVFLSIGNFGITTAVASNISISQEKKEIKGKVLDQSGQTIPGVSVSIKGTNEGAWTDINGEFVLSVSPNDILVVSFVGMQEQQIKVGDKNYFKIVMKDDSIQVAEVVCTGFGVKKRNEFTGSISTVNKEKLETIPVASVEEALKGNVAGLTSVSSSGQPGAAQEIRIRGISSISASSSPLYVIDGVPVVSGDFSRNTTTSNVMAGLSSSDIESISILKDASATSVYGARGANGVIVITTKKGKQGEVKYNFNVEYGMNDMTFEGPGKLSSTQWEELMFEGLMHSEYAQYVGGYTKKELCQMLLGLPDWDTKINTDWQDAIIRKTAKQEKIGISMQGGNNKTNYFTSVNYFNQEGIVKNSSFKRVSGLLNLNTRANDKLTIQTKLNISHSDQKSLPGGPNFSNPLIGRYFTLACDPAFNKDGSPYLPQSGFMMNGMFNPAFLLENDSQGNLTTKILGNVQGFWRPIEDLKYTLKVGMDYINIEENSWRNPYHGDGYSTQGNASALYTRNFNWVVQNMLDYHYELDLDNKFDFKMMYEAQKNKNFGIDTYAKRTASGDMHYLNVYSLPADASSSLTSWTTASMMFNANYSWKSKLFADATFRREGNSRFSNEHKYGNFWSVGFSYLLNKESFMQSLDWLSELKLRTSYGVNGNAGIPSNLYLAAVSYSGSYNDYPATYNSGVINEDLTWELNKPFNIAADFGLFNNKVVGTIEYFTRTTSDLLLGVSVSRTTGHSSVTKNIGEMKNSGWEFTLSTTNLDGDFKWNTDFNFTKIKNEVTELNKIFNEQTKEWENIEMIGSATIVKVGENINSWYLKKWVGVDPKNGDPLWERVIKNSKGEVVGRETTNDYNKATKEIRGHSTPSYFGGITNNFSYKGFDLSFQINFMLDYQVYDSWAYYMQSDGLYTANYGGYDSQVDRWQKRGDHAKNPKTVLGGNKNSNENSTRFLYDGDHLRLRDITFSYNLPKSLLKGTGIGNLNVYAKGTNMFTYCFDEDLKFDPECGEGGMLDMALPMMKTVTFGVKLNF